MIKNQSRVAKYVSGFQSHLDQFFLFRIRVWFPKSFRSIFDLG